MVRGGSWINESDNARTAIRNDNNPDNRNNNIGFRVLLCLRQHSEEASCLQARTVSLKGGTGVPKCESRRGSGVGRHDRRAKSRPAPRGLVGAGRRSSRGIF
ncbi:MAG: SUMF1/EgtB/PvdO family nonheme iron enzyme [Gammaproteobacteria bacterium]|nr:SUMF1/EgtB/PvdO family nonheme iron enzyme [Gammaproteobacteria bacterium]